MQNYYRESGYGLLMLGAILIVTALFDTSEGPLFSPVYSTIGAIISIVIGIVFINLGKKYK